MTTLAKRQTIIEFSGDANNTEVVRAADNTNSPGMEELRTLASGLNTITVPTGGSTPKSVTIIPPPANVVTMTLKGVTGDTGILLHLTDPTTIALASSVTTFVITTNAILTGIRFIWT